MAHWIEDPQGRLEVEKVTKEMKLPVWKANHKGKFRDFWNELWDKIEDYILKLKGDTEKNSKGLNDRLVSAVGKHDGDFPITNAVVGNVYYSELTKKYYKCKVGGPAPMPNGNFIDMSILENLNRLENFSRLESEKLSITNATDIRVYKIAGMVTLIVDSGTAFFNKNGVPIFTLPEKYRPDKTLYFSASYRNSTKSNTFFLYANGNLIKSEADDNAGAYYFTISYPAKNIH
ncbi:hypothetical protein FSDG_01604 [Fusobacterium animalis 7_1]|uniref:Uncharacterized protein n=2 Tax=root TaxID=1 RepID=A0A140PV64_9FUSO|nr:MULTISPECIES: hypothetical protein [Fusobacterium]AKC57567.1 hypothetical protein HMPREF1994_00008 [Fusobacterium phage Funu2]EEO43045.1 hypothetical protein FSDG_01604 [Fusobacterium animalis 7_1]EPC08279.1 hypothetical protein HMPREF9369_03083 [Fusobacterium polymorphum F0401]